MKFIILTGLSACGKTTISQEISSRLEIPRIDFHAIAHDIAQEHGFSRLRDWAKSVGTADALAEATQRLVQELQRVRVENPRGIIVDEIVAPGAFERVRELFPRDEFYVICIKANIENRIRNMTKRVVDSEDVEEAISFRDGFKYSFGVEGMIARANFTFYNDRTIEEITNEVIQAVREKIFSEGNREVSVHGERECP